MWNQSRPDGGDNNSVNTVNMTPRCRTVSDESGREVFEYTADEYSDTSKTDTADLDDTIVSLRRMYGMICTVRFGFLIRVW